MYVHVHVHACVKIVLFFLDPTFVRTFLMTYRSFSNPKELMELLVARFHIPIPVNMDDPEIRRDSNMMKAVKRFKANYITPIQLRYMYVGIQRVFGYIYFTCIVLCMLFRVQIFMHTHVCYTFRQFMLKSVVFICTCTCKSACSLHVLKCVSILSLFM